MNDRGPEQREARRQRDRSIGLVIISVTFLLALGVSWWARRASRPELSKPPAPPTTVGIVGYPKAVDPIKTLPAARKITERTILRGITAEGVDSDGTVDVDSPTGRIRYEFQSPPGQGPQPRRPPGTLPTRPYCGKQTVHLGKKGLYADPDVPGYPCSPIHYDELPQPRCTMKDVWKHAIALGAPKDHLARIQYYRAHAGPAWRFDMPGTRYRFSLYGDCGRELKGADARTIFP